MIIDVVVTDVLVRRGYIIICIVVVAVALVIVPVEEIMVVVSATSLAVVVDVGSCVNTRCNSRCFLTACREVKTVGARWCCDMVPACDSTRPGSTGAEVFFLFFFLYTILEKGI